MKSARRIDNAIFAIAIASLLPPEASPYPWPTANINTQHSIFGTLGEFRPGHLHEGVDTEPGANGSARAVVAGSIAPGDVGADCITLGSFRYCHVDPDPAITQHFQNTQSPQNPQGTPFPVAVGDVIAQVKANGTHLHFEELQGGANPLASLTPFTDTRNPTVHSVDVSRDGGGTFTVGVDGITIVRGNVEILSNASDAMSQGSGVVAPYNLGFRVVRQANNQEVVPLTTRLVFNSIIGGNIGRVYDAGSTRSNYNYFVTNFQNTNGFWDSCTTPDDGLYDVFVRAGDISGNGASLSRRVRVDCTPPGLVDIQPAADSFIADARPEIRATIEDEQTDVDESTIKLFVNGVEKTFTIVQPMASVTISHTPTEDLPEGQNTIRIVAADLAGNELDTSVSFIVDGTPPALTLIDSDGNPVGEAGSTGADGITLGASLDCYRRSTP